MVDAVTDVVEQWRRERPDLDLARIAVAARLTRAAQLVRSAQESVLGSQGLQSGEFDVLASLRRAGEPYTLTPSHLAATMLLSRAAMTSRLDRLEQAGLVSRRLDPDNRRSFLVTLTDEGHAVTDRAMSAHTANTDAVLAHLATDELRALDDLLSQLLGGLDANSP